jgi:hypothetical protein
MGASISFDSKYRLILDTEVECISVSPPVTSAVHKSKKDHRRDRARGGANGSDNESDSGSDRDNDSASGSDSESDSDSENKTYTVKITPEIVNYIRSYLRKNEFLDEFDLITEIELDNYNHAPGSALVFNSDSIVFITNNQTIEAVGEWEYLPPDNHPAATLKSKSKSKSKSKNRHNDDDDDDDNENDFEKESSKYKNKDDELPVSEIESIMKEKFEEYNTTHEFIIHESKNSFLCLKINSVDIVKA